MGAPIASAAARSGVAVVTRGARSVPPSPEVMPHGTSGDLLANLLALRFAPRSGTPAEPCAPTKAKPEQMARGVDSQNWYPSI